MVQHALDKIVQRPHKALVIVGHTLVRVSDCTACGRTLDTFKEDFIVVQGVVFNMNE